MKHDIRLIAACGRNGQLGLNGRMPWRDPEDLQWFRKQTRGGIVIMGARTYDPLEKHFKHHREGRTFVVWNGTQAPERAIEEAIEIKMHENTPHRTIWIAGGAHTYAAFLPFVRLSIITHADYTGPADAWMPPLFKSGEDHGN